MTADPGLARERTLLARRRTVLPFLLVAVLGARAALAHPGRGSLLVGLALLGAAVAQRGRPGALVAVVLLAAAAAALVPG